jgi:hypothetical protein
MCLLRPNERNNACLHEECKQLSAANKQGCLFSLAQAIRPDDPFGSSNILRPAQNHSRTLSQASQLLRNHSLQNFANQPISHPAPADDASDSEEQFTLNKKKIKFEGNHNNSQSQDNTRNNPQPNIQFTNIQASPFHTSLSDSVFARQQILNMPRSSNQDTNGQINPMNFPVYQVPQPMYVPYMQISQDPNQNGVFLTYPQNFNQQNLPVAQNFGQTMRNHTTSEDSIQTTTPSERVSKENNSGLEELLKDMQNKMVDLLSTQNKMLLDLREKNELVQDTLACLINEVNTLKKVVKQNGPEKPLPVVEQTIIGPESFREIPNSETLIRTLYGEKQQDFKYQIVLKNEFPVPLYRERNFKFTVFLTDLEGNLVKNTNRIPLTIAIYTSENTPKYVDVNTSGNKVLKGMIDKDLVDGSVTFDKIQIKEVTSHFRNGWIFFVVQPRSSGNVLNNLIDMTNGVMINPQNVRPLVIEKMVVKAKRAREKKDQDFDLDLEEGKDLEIDDIEQDTLIITESNQNQDEIYV